MNAQPKGENLVKGTVKDVSGLGMIGAVVMVEGTTIGTAVEADGTYTLNIGKTKNGILVFSAIGFKTVKIPIGEKRVFDVIMEEDPSLLDEVVVVGYGGQKRVSVTGSVSTVKSEDIDVGNSSSLATAMTGRLPGTVIVQGSGEAGARATSVSIRGAGSPLVLVDGIERDYQDLDMDEVKSITVLKDASATAVYGIRGGNGVMIITTKRGQEGGFKVNFKTEFGLLHKNGDGYPRSLNSYEYATLKNEGIRNSHDLPWNEVSEYDLYSPEDIQLFQNGRAPLTHANSDWSSIVLNDFGHKERTTLTLQGGNKFFRTFVSLAYMNERDLYRDFKLPYNDNSSFQRYNIRANVDLDLSKTTTLSVDFGGQFSNRHAPGIWMNGITSLMWESMPFAATLYGDRVVSTRRPFSMQATSPLDYMYDRGYSINHTNRFQVAAKLDQQLDFITKGLKFNASVSYDQYFTNNFSAEKGNTSNILAFIDETTGKVREAQPGTMDVNPETGEVYDPLNGRWISQYDIPIIQNGPEKVMRNSRSTGTGPRQINFRASLNYNRTFNDKHNVQGLVVFTTNSVSFHNGQENYVPLRYMEFAARLSYNYDDRYMVEFNGGYNGSEKFAKDHRFGFFPALSLGWVLTNEHFMKKSNVLSFLKLRLSYGTTGLDSGGNRFMYYDKWALSYGGGYLFGMEPMGLGAAYQTTFGNPLVQWATNYQSNIGIETEWFKNRLELDADLYRNDRKGMLMNPQIVPATVGANLPAMNMRDVRYQGIEVQARWKDKIKNVKYHVFANFNYADAINMFIDEPARQYPWQVQTGKHPNLFYGYETVGFYTEEDIAKLYGEQGGVGTPEIPTTSHRSTELKPGDLKYKDLNKDGKITVDDKKYFEKTMNPKTSYGFGAGIDWKNLKVDLFFQGVANVGYMMGPALRTPFRGGTKNAPAIAFERWTPERYANGERILYPRMTPSGDVYDHNFQQSDFWIYDTSYLKLKNVTISYSFKTKALKDAKISALTLSLTGTNLLTISDFPIGDPEMRETLTFPVSANRGYTIGLNLSF